MGGFIRVLDIFSLNSVKPPPDGFGFETGNTSGYRGGGLNGPGHLVLGVLGGGGGP